MLGRIWHFHSGHVSSSEENGSATEDRSLHSAVCIGIYDCEGHALDMATICSDENRLALLRQLDALGERSGQSQELKGPITTLEKLAASAHTNPALAHSLLLYEDRGIALGFLKYGAKDLFFYKANGTLVHAPGTLCLLDFYVSEELQRHGIGKTLFRLFLQCTQVPPGKVAYDRPSPKLLPFLHRHCGLAGADLQPNKYTIFPKLFFA